MSVWTTCATFPREMSFCGRGHSGFAFALSAFFYPQKRCFVLLISAMSHERVARISLSVGELIAPAALLL